MDNYKNEKVLVIGLARSGLAAVKLLLELGADITVSESKPLDEIKELDFLRSSGVRVVRQSDDVFAEDFSLVIKNPGINGKLPFIAQFRERGIPVITEIELAFRVCAPQHFIAVTGTNGKTTTATLLYEILNKAFPGKAHLSGNIGIALCETVLENRLMTETGHYIVLEISNFQLLDIDRFRPQIAVIINLAADHLDFMGSEDAYYRSKCRVYENMRDGDIFLKNADDGIVSEYTSKIPVNCETVTYSVKGKADFYADDENIYCGNETLMPLSEIKVVGRHNVQNILTCAAAAVSLGADKAVIREAVSEFRGVEHRIEYVTEKNGIRYYNDSKGTNVDATITALKSFGCPVILLAGGYEKGLSFDPLKPYLRGVKKVIAFGACGKRLVDELTDGEGTLCETLPEALAEAEKIAESGDVVLLSPTTSSFDQYSCFEERGDHFKELVTEKKA